MKAWVATYAVAMPCLTAAAESRDTMVIHAAQQRGIPIVTLETPEEVQAQRDKLLASVGERVFIDSMKASLREAGAQLITDYIGALNAGDYDEVARISRRYAVDPSEADGFDRYMVSECNALWVPRLKDDLRGGGAVVMVGAGHLPGPGGLIALLRRDGYDVQPITLPAASH